MRLSKKGRKEEGLRHRNLLPMMTDSVSEDYLPPKNHEKNQKPGEMSGGGGLAWSHTL